MWFHYWRKEVYRDAPTKTDKTIHAITNFPVWFIVLLMILMGLVF